MGIEAIHPLLAFLSSRFASLVAQDCPIWLALCETEVFQPELHETGDGSEPPPHPGQFRAPNGRYGAAASDGFLRRLARRPFL